MKHDILPEEKLLLSLSKIFFGSGDKAAAESILCGDIDIEYFLDLCRSHHTLSVCFRNLEKIEGAATDGAKGALLGRLKGYYKQQVAKNMVLVEECADLLRGFDRSNVKAVVNQGMALLCTVYSGDIGLRPMMDMDFLVQKSVLDRAKEVLLGMGYVLHRPEKEEFARGFETSLVFIRKARRFAAAPLTVELHYWDDYRNDPIGCAYDFDIEGIFRRAVCTDFQGTRAFVLKTEDFLVHHIFHAALSHQFSRLVWFNDIALIMNLDGFDNELFMELYKNAGLDNIMYAAFDIMRRLYGSEWFKGNMPSPAPPGSKIKRNWISHFTADKALLTNHLFDRKRNCRGRVLINKIMYFFAMLKSGRSLRMLKGIMLPDRVWLEHVYGGGSMRKAAQRALHPLTAVCVYGFSIIVYYMRGITKR